MMQRNSLSNAYKVFRLLNICWKSNKSAGKIPLPPEPTYCCNSGCSNCVWIKYAQELAQMYEDGDIIARNKIQEKVKDPKLKAFLLTQLGLAEKEK